MTAPPTPCAFTACTFARSAWTAASDLRDVLLMFGGETRTVGATGYVADNPDNRLFRCHMRMVSRAAPGTATWLRMA